MKAELKLLTSVDIDELTYWPEIEDQFGFNVEAEIGPENENTSEHFTFLCARRNGYPPSQLIETLGVLGYSAGI